MRKLALIALSVLLSATMWAEKVHTFDKLLKPSRLLVKDQLIYITQFPTVYIYSLNDFKLIKQFGQKGQGPKEFDRWVDVSPLQDKLLVNSQGKMTYWTLKGEFLKEIKIPLANGVEPLEDYYAGMGYASDKEKIVYQTINIYDPQFKKVTEIGRKKSSYQHGRSIAFYEQLFYFIVCDGDKLFVSGNDGFLIDVYNKTGKKLFSITRDYKKQKVTDADKQVVYDWHKNHPRYKAYFERMKPMIKFADYFPAYRDFFEYDHKLYIRTYNKKDEKTEFFVYSLEGKFIQQVYIPIKEIDFRTDFPYYIDNQTLYRLEESPETEEWSLHTFKIN